MGNLVHSLCVHSGIFFGSADIKQQLPNEYARFRSIDGEFVALMRRVAANPKVLDVLALQGLGPSLDRLLGLLEKIQKALGE